MEFFDSKKAQVLLREVFMTKEIADALGGLTKEEVEQIVHAEAIELVQNERMIHLENVKKFKEDIEKKFPSYRFSARLKSLPSIFGKMLRHGALADVFGIKVIVPTIEECYYFKEWLCEHYAKFSFDDKIKKPKENGYRDLKVVISYHTIETEPILVEFIIQTPQMYVDSHTIQKHQNVYPWKYHDVIKNLPAEYEYIEF